MNELQRQIQGFILRILQDVLSLVGESIVLGLVSLGLYFLFTLFIKPGIALMAGSSIELLLVILIVVLISRNMQNGSPD